MAQPDFVIAGAGIIGLSLALELNRQGASVTVLEAGNATRQTSSAAAGMLAVDDLANPPELYPLAQLSASLYPDFLDRITELGGQRVAFQTSSTLEADSTNPLPDPHEVVPELAAHHPPLRLLAEHSVDPRQLAPALIAAVRATSIELREQTSLTRISANADSVSIQTSGESLTTSFLVDCMGSWSPAPVAPRKGQMLAVRMPARFDLDAVVRTHDVYIVPRTEGDNAGLAIIGATIESAGFDLTVHPKDILGLNARAVALLPGLARAEFVESWSGLRPATRDGLPILGAVPRQPRYLLATGHFRNGILLAPATAHVMAQLLLGKTLAVDLERFSPARFRPGDQ